MKEPSLNEGRYEAYEPSSSATNAKDLIEKDRETRILAAQRMSEISVKFCKGKGVQRFRVLQEDLMRNADILVSAGVMSYDKLIEKVSQLEEHVDEHGGNDSDKIDPQERVRDWLNNEG